MIDVSGVARDADITDDGAEFLRKAHEIEHTCALPFKICGHGDQLANGHNTRTSDASDDDIPWRGQCRHYRLVQCLRQPLKRRRATLAPLLQRRALDGDKARAEAV